MTRRRAAAALAVAITCVVGAASPAAAHGVGGRRDLPVELWQFLYAAVFALIVSFLLLRISWATPRLAAAASGRRLGRAVDRVAPIAEVLVRTLGLVLFALTISAAWIGDENSRNNIAPVMIYVALWVGVQILSIVLGDLWAWLSPYETLALLASRTRGSDAPAGTPRAADDDSLVWSHWPAAVGLLGFVWLELCYHTPSSPRVLASLATLYSAWVLAMAARFGRRWLRTGEAFGVMFGFVALMAPLWRDAEGHVRIRAPFAGLASFVPRRGTVPLVAAILGGTAFDGVQRTQWWSDLQGTSVGWHRTGIASIGLACTVLAVGVAYTAAAMLAARLAGDDRRAAPRRYAHSLVPIAFGYAVAHYFTLLIIEGQSLIPLFSNPYGRNWNLFGTVDHVIDIEPLGPQTVAWVQVLAIVGGHVAGVVVAHDRAVADHPHDVATRSQIPMLVVMIAFTLLGLTLLLKG